jgi:hypothetical protein
LRRVQYERQNCSLMSSNSNLVHWYKKIVNLLIVTFTHAIFFKLVTTTQMIIFAPRIIYCRCQQHQRCNSSNNVTFPQFIHESIHRFTIRTTTIHFSLFFTHYHSKYEIDTAGWETITAVDISTIFLSADNSPPHMKINTN